MQSENDLDVLMIQDTKPNEPSPYLSIVDRIARRSARVSPALDNITPTNRAFVDERLAELDREKQGVERRLEELERLAWQDQEIAMLISEVGAFLHQLSWTLESGSRFQGAQRRAGAATGPGGYRGRKEQAPRCRAAGSLRGSAFC